MTAVKRVPRRGAAATHIPRKRFSQNFLVDEGAIAAIVQAIGPRAGDNMVEIGPGLGALTAALAAIVRPLHVIEIDRDLVARLRQRYTQGEIAIHEGDVLTFDFAALGPHLRVVGNLPYHISTPILFRLVEYAERLQDVHVMLQKEVVERMVASPNASDYGRLSVMLQYRFSLKKLLDVAPSSFRPAPQVASAVVRMTPAPGAPRARDDAMFGRLVAAAFAQRRKTLRNTLKGHMESAELERLGISPGARAQELAVTDFVALADYVAARG